MDAVYSVFYELSDVFEICRTDFSSVEAADQWVSNDLLQYSNAEFYFILKNGHILIKGDLIDDSLTFFEDCMKFSNYINADDLMKKRCKSILGPF